MAPRPWIADIALIAVVAIWGYTFVIVKDAIGSIPVFTFLFLRFAVAAFAFLPFLLRRARRSRAAGRARGIPVGLGVGALLGLGYVLQTLGLQHTTAGRAGVITGISVVLVPFAAWRLLHQRVRIGEWTGVALAVAGFALLGLGEGSLGIGDLLVLGCAVAFAGHIVALARVAPGRDVLPLAAIQVTTVAGLTGLAALFLEVPHGLPRLSGAEWRTVGIAVLVTGWLATTGGFAVQTWAQRTTTPTRVALILSLEPVFAMLASWIWAGELMTGTPLIGAGCIVAGMLVAELAPRRPPSGRSGPGDRVRSD